MKKLFTLSLGIAALAFGIFLSIAGSQANAQSATSDTELGGQACVPASDLGVASYDIDYGDASGSDFTNGFVNAGTKSGASVITITDNCGTGTWEITASFTNMAGASNGGTITPQAHGLVQTVASPYYTETAGNLGDAVTGHAGNWSGDDTISLMTRTQAGGYVGETTLGIDHHIQIDAGEVPYDTSYDGTWEVTMNL